MENSDNNYTAVPMEQRRPNSDHKEHALEKPFDEEFWVKVSGTLSLLSMQFVLISKTSFLDLHKHYFHGLAVCIYSKPHNRSCKHK